MSRRSVLGLTAAVVLLGCGSSDDEGTSGVELPPESVPIAGCEAYDYTGCDVLDEVCRREVMELVSCLRGNDLADLPPVRVSTADEYRLELEAHYADEEPVDPRYETVIAWLDLAQLGSFSTDSLIEAAVEGVAAYYSPDAQEIVVVTPDAPVDPPDLEWEKSLLAHETVHALQDLELDLDGQEAARGNYYDPWLAFRSTIEGEAEVYQTLILAAMWTLSIDDLDLVGRFDAMTGEAIEYVLGGSTPIFRTLDRFPYTFGAAYVAEAYQAGGTEAVRTLTRAPPEATLPIAFRDVDAVVDDWWPDPPAGAAGAAVDLEDSLGAWLLRLTLLRAGASLDESTVAASWRGDRLWIYGSEDAPEALWHLRFAAAQEASAAAAVLRDLYRSPESTVRRNETDVYVFMGALGVDTVAWADAVAPLP